MELFNRYQVNAVIAEHFYRDELHRLGKLPLFVAAPLSGHFSWQATFRVYKCSDGQLSFHAVYLK